MNVEELINILKQMPPSYEVVLTEKDYPEIEIYADEMLEQVNIDGYLSIDKDFETIHTDLSDNLKKIINEERKHRKLHRQIKNEHFIADISDYEVKFTTNIYQQPFCTLYSKYNRFASSDFDKDQIDVLAEGLSEIFYKMYADKIEE